MKYLAVAVGVAGLALIVLCIVFSVKQCNAETKCRDEGGMVERYNYRTIYTTQSCGKNCTIVVPIQTSDWRCVGRKAERE